MSDLRTIHFNAIKATLAGKCQRVHDALGARPPCTAKELADAMQWEVTSVRPRLTQLKDVGLVETTGERRNSENVFRYVSRATAELRAAHTSDTIKQLALF